MAKESWIKIAVPPLLRFERSARTIVKSFILSSASMCELFRWVSVRIKKGILCGISAIRLSKNGSFHFWALTDGFIPRIFSKNVETSIDLLGRFMDFILQLEFAIGNIGDSLLTGLKVGSDALVGCCRQSFGSDGWGRLSYFLGMPLKKNYFPDFGFVFVMWFLGLRQSEICDGSHCLVSDGCDVFLLHYRDVYFSFFSCP